MNSFASSATEKQIQDDAKYVTRDSNLELKGNEKFKSFFRKMLTLFIRFTHTCKNVIFGAKGFVAFSVVASFPTASL